MSNNPPFSSNQANPGEEGKQEESLFSNPFGYLYRKSATVIEKGSGMVHAVGSSV